MDKLSFQVGQEYKVCSKCKAIVSAKLKKCDECRELLPRKFARFTQEDYDAVRAGNGPVSIADAEDEFTQKCSNCGKLFPYGISVCDTPGCGGILEPFFPEIPSVVASDAEEAEIVSIVNDIPESEERENTEEKLRFFFEAYRYENAVPVKSNTALFPIDGKFSIGRGLLYGDERFFYRNLNNDQKRSIAEHFATIRRDHCNLLERNGRLYIELADEKSSVRINGKKIRTEEIVEVHDTDEILIGSGDDRSRKILLVIKRAMVTRETAKPLSSNMDAEALKAFLLEELSKVRRDVQTDITQMRTEMTEYLTSFTRENLRRQDDESDDQYVSRILEAEEEDEKTTDTKMSVEDRIHQFLLIEGADGQVRDYMAEYHALKERQQIVVQLRAVAKIEPVHMESDDEDEDFSDLVLLMGKIVEEVIIVYLASICNKLFPEEYERSLMEHQGTKENLEMGFVVRFLTKSSGYESRIWQFVDAVGLPHNDTSYNSIFKLVENLRFGADSRNKKGGHAPASKGTRNQEKLKNYVRKNDVTIITKDEYLEIKRKIFCRNMFQTVKKYYKKICIDENR